MTGAQYPSTTGYVNHRRSRSWSNTAGYKLTQRAALLTQNYTDEQENQSYGSAKVKWPANFNSGCSSGVFLQSFAVYPTLLDSGLSECLQKAQLNAANKVGDYTVDLGVAAIEARKTGQMIADAAISLAKAGSQVRKGNFAGAAATLGLKSAPSKARKGRSFSNNWLEYRYGWRTLMMDVDGSMRALAESYIAKPPIIVVKSIVRNTFRTSSTVAWGNIAGGAGGEQTNITKLFEYLYEATVIYRFRVYNPSLASANSLGLVNPATLVWELIPYSFVVDWFANVGDVLRHMTTFTGKDLVDGSQCLMGNVKSTIECKDYRVKVSTYPLVYAYGTGAPCYSSSDMRIFERKKLNGFVGITPRINFSMNLPRALDAVSLLKQFLK